MSSHHQHPTSGPGSGPSSGRWESYNDHSYHQQRERLDGHRSQPRPQPQPEQQVYREYYQPPYYASRDRPYGQEPPPPHAQRQDPLDHYPAQSYYQQYPAARPPPPQPDPYQYSHTHGHQAPIQPPPNDRRYAEHPAYYYQQREQGDSYYPAPPANHQMSRPPAPEPYYYREPSPHPYPEQYPPREYESRHQLPPQLYYRELPPPPPASAPQKPPALPPSQLQQNPQPLSASGATSAATAAPPPPSATAPPPYDSFASSQNQGNGKPRIARTGSGGTSDSDSSQPASPSSVKSRTHEPYLKADNPPVDGAASHEDQQGGSTPSLPQATAVQQSGGERVAGGGPPPPPPLSQHQQPRYAPPHAPSPSAHQYYQQPPPPAQQQQQQHFHQTPPHAYFPQVSAEDYYVPPPPPQSYHQQQYYDTQNEAPVRRGHYTQLQIHVRGDRKPSSGQIPPPQWSDYPAPSPTMISPGSYGNAPPPPAPPTAYGREVGPGYATPPPPPSGADYPRSGVRYSESNGILSMPHASADVYRRPIVIDVPMENDPSRGARNGRPRVRGNSPPPRRMLGIALAAEPQQQPMATTQHTNSSQSRLLNDNSITRGTGAGAGAGSAVSVTVGATTAFRPIVAAAGEFLRLDGSKVNELLVKPANPMSREAFARQINLLTGMSKDLILDYIVANCTMAELAQQGDGSSGPSIPPRGSPTASSEGGSYGHRFLQRYLPFLPYPSWVATLGPVSGTNAKAVAASQRESPSAASLPSMFPQPQYVPTLEELRQVLANMRENNNNGGGSSSVAHPLQPASIDVDPEAEKRAQAQFAESDIRTTGLACRHFERLFIGNIKKDIPLSFLQWLIDAFSLPSSSAGLEDLDGPGATGVGFTTESNSQTYPTANYIYDCSIHRHSSNGAFKGCIHATLATNDDPTIFRRFFHRRLLFDYTGVWVATTPAEEELMHAYSNAFGKIKDEAELRIRELLGNLPRSPMSWEAAGNAHQTKCTRRAETQAEFVQLLRDCRNPAHIPSRQ